MSKHGPTEEEVMHQMQRMGITSVQFGSRTYTAPPRDPNAEPLVGHGDEVRPGDHVIVCTYDDGELVDERAATLLDWDDEEAQEEGGIRDEPLGPHILYRPHDAKETDGPTSCYIGYPGQSYIRLLRKDDTR